MTAQYIGGPVNYTPPAKSISLLGIRSKKTRRLEM